MYHQYICVVVASGTYCFGLTTHAPPYKYLDAPGSFEGDSFNQSCTGQSTKKCVDSCLLGLLEGPPPNYSLPDRLGGMNCQMFAGGAIDYCKAQCATSSN